MDDAIPMVRFTADDASKAIDRAKLRQAEEIVARVEVMGELVLQLCPDLPDWQRISDNFHEHLQRARDQVAAFKAQVDSM